MKLDMMIFAMIFCDLNFSPTVQIYEISFTLGITAS